MGNGNYEGFAAGGRIYLAAAVEIGRGPTEAKALLQHGKSGKWLEESVSYSQSTADRFMKVFKEYGSKLLDASDSNSNYAPVRNLTYSQAVFLLGVPEEGREQFIIDMDIEGRPPMVFVLHKLFNFLLQIEK